MDHLPKYLRLSRHLTFYFRKRLSPNLARLYDQQELNISLGTKCSEIASQMALEIKFKIDQISHHQRRYKAQGLSEKACKELLCLHIERLKNDQHRNLCNGYTESNNYDIEYLGKMSKETKFEKEVHDCLELRVWLAEKERELENQFIDTTFLGQEHLFTIKAQQFSEYSIAVKQVVNDLYIEHDKNTRLEKDLKNVSSNNSQQIEAPLDVDPGNFSTVIDDYLSYLQKSKGNKKPTGSTIADYRTKLNFYKKILKDKPFYKITKQDIVNCKKITYNLPQNISRIKWENTHISLEELVYDENHGYPTIEVTTISKYLSQLKKICQHAFENNYCSINPSASIKFEYTKKVQNERVPFSKKELEAIFNSYLYNDTPPPSRVKLKDYQFWLPIMGAFTGARLNEICSLYLRDIILDPETKHYYIDINSSGSDKKTKTDSSKRQVPILKVVIDMGLLDYIQELKKSSQTRLFPELKYSEKEGYGKEASRWFCKLEKKDDRYLKGFLALTGIKTPETPKHSKNFHCFRHTFIKYLKNNSQLDLYKVGDLVGHENGDLQTRSYGGKEYSLEAKINTIEKLDYQIDLSHINWRKYLLKKSLTPKANSF